MSNSRFDVASFYSALDSQREAQGKTWKQVANEAKVSASTLTRMRQGKRPDIDGLAALAAWSKLDINQFVRGRDQGSGVIEPLTQISALLRADRNLKGKNAAVLEAIVKSAYAQLRKTRNEA
jgi:transcriptional regulator with XRE-family HTH domain